MKEKICLYCKNFNFDMGSFPDIVNIRRVTPASSQALKGRRRGPRIRRICRAYGVRQEFVLIWRKKNEKSKENNSRSREKD